MQLGPRVSYTYSIALKLAALSAGGYRAHASYRTLLLQPRALTAATRDFQRNPYSYTYSYTPIFSQERNATGTTDTETWTAGLPAMCAPAWRKTGSQPVFIAWFAYAPRGSGIAASGEAQATPGLRRAGVRTGPRPVHHRIAASTGANHLRRRRAAIPNNPSPTNRPVPGSGTMAIELKKASLLAPVPAR